MSSDVIARMSENLAWSVGGGLVVLAVQFAIRLKRGEYERPKPNLQTAIGMGVLLITLIVALSSISTNVRSGQANDRAAVASREATEAADKAREVSECLARVQAANVAALNVSREVTQQIADARKSKDAALDTLVAAILTSFTPQGGVDTGAVQEALQTYQIAAANAAAVELAGEQRRRDNPYVSPPSTCQ